MRRYQAVCLNSTCNSIANRTRNCTQCLNVGFECKTSDKLSRRAFPRGYTESLEEQVRSLEAEVRELKRILDEKDNVIDLLSRMHPGSSPFRTSQKLTDAASISPADSTEHALDDGEAFNAIQPTIVEDGQPETLLFGASSLRPMLRALRDCVVDTSLTTHRLFKPKAFGEWNTSVDGGSHLCIPNRKARRRTDERTRPRPDDD
jgi:hypothetical protein